MKKRKKQKCTFYFFKEKYRKNEKLRISWLTKLIMQLTTMDKNIGVNNRGYISPTNLH